MVDSLTAADTAELPLAADGQLTVRTLPGPHGRAHYLVRGRHVRGTLIVIPHTTYDGPVLAEQVRVQFGDGADRAAHGRSRLDEPVVRGIRVQGHTAAIDPRTVTTNTPLLCGDAVAVREDGRIRRIPDGARTVLEAVVIAVVRHWQQRQDRDALIRAAARYSAGERAGGIYVFYGRPTGSDWYGRACHDEPTVNGVQLSGGWSHPRSSDITPTSPTRLPAGVRIDDTRSHSAPYATSIHASAVLRALALHYLARPDVAGLRIAAGKLRAEENLKAARAKLARVHREETRLAGKLRHRTLRQRQFTALLLQAPSERSADETRPDRGARAA